MTRTILAAAAALLLTAPLAAQTTDDANWEAYNDQKRNAWLATGIEALVPTVGHAYAGNWKRGLLPAAVGIGGYAVAFSVLDSCEGECTDSQNSQIGLAALVGIGGNIWGLISAYDTAATGTGSCGSGIGFRPTSPSGRFGTTVWSLRSRLDSDERTRCEARRDAGLRGREPALSRQARPRHGAGALETEGSEGQRSSGESSRCGQQKGRSGT